MNQFSPVSALIGGAIIGAATSLLLATHGRIAGISGIYGSVIRRATSDRAWRVWFLAGLAVAGMAVRLIHPAAFATSWNATLPVVVAAGLLVGIGTQMGSGCTSGHGVCGISRLSPRSLIATATFIPAGMVTVFFVRHLLGSE